MISSVSAPSRGHTWSELSPEPRHDDEVVVSARVERKDYGRGQHAEAILRDLAVDVKRGEFLSVLGPSGCGKTTFLRLVAGLDNDYRGRIEVHGAPVRCPSLSAGVVFQEPRLLPWFTVRRNVAFALPPTASVLDRDREVTAALDLVGLNSHAGKLPYQLSGGMAARTALARALVNRPSLLLLDEPFASLDSPTRHALHDALAQIHVSRRAAAILVTHDLEEAVYLSDRVLVLTQRPATIGAIVPIEVPRPRDRRSSAFRECCMTLFQALVSQENPV